MLLLFYVVAAFGLTVHDIQYSTTGVSPYEGDTVTVSAIVTATDYDGDKYYIGDPGGGPWSGVYVYDYTYSVSPGDWITITAEVDEFYDLTELKNVTALTVDSTGSIPPAYATNCADADTSEALEGVLTTLSNLVVTDDNHDEWEVTDATGTLKVKRGFDYGYSPTTGDTIISLTGIISYSFGEFFLEPRFDDDIETSDTTVIDTTEAPYHTIAELQADPSAFDGDTVRIEGVVTIGVGLIDDDYLKAYVQDTSGAGLLLFDYDIPPEASELIRGALISVTGEIDEYSGVLELKFPEWDVLATGQPLPTPVDAFSLSNPEDEDGTWMSVGGKVSSISSYSDASNIYVSNGITELAVRVWATTGIDISDISTGDSVIIHGASSIYSGDFQLLPGYQEDITVVADTGTPPDTGLTPIADIQTNLTEYLGEDVTIRGVITIAAGALRDDMLNAYIQDESGMGIQLFEYDLTAEMESSMVRGAVIQVEGEVDDYQNVTEIKLDSWEAVGSDTLPAALSVLDVWDNLTDYEGTWIFAEGPIVDKWGSEDFNIVIDASGTLEKLVEVRVWGTTGITGDNIDIGDRVRVYGVGDIYYDEFQLVPGAPEDIETLSVESPTEISLSVEEGVLVPSIGEKLDIEFSVPAGNRAVLRLYDRMGRSATTLYDGNPYAVTRLEWDGRDETGQFVRHGVYMLYLESIGTTGDRETARATIAIGSVMK